MLEQDSLDRALCLPAPDVAALLEGQLIAAIPLTTVQQGWSFALYPCSNLLSSIPFEQQYQNHALPSVKNAIAEIKAANFPLTSWAKCEFFQIFHEWKDVEVLAHKTIWGQSLLKKLFEERQYVFLAYLRVHHFAKPLILERYIDFSEKLGKFTGLPTLGLPDSVRLPLRVDQSLPVISNESFERRKRQLQESSLVSHTGLEKLVSELSMLEQKDSQSKILSQEVKEFLGWRCDEEMASSIHLPDWINLIVDAGNSSDGNEFEKLVRRGLLGLGFSNSRNDPKASLDPDATGGAGGLDVYCDAPFSLVGECKASKYESVPNGVSAQLINLGNTHLGKDLFEKSVKIIFTSGTLTSHAEKAAVENRMNVMRPETLQKLVTLKVNYPGSINLLDLKSCLETQPFGQDADSKVEEYINRVLRDINLRSHVVQVVKNFLERAGSESADTSQLHTSYLFSTPPEPLTQEQLRNILIELSSPLTGYIGRRRTTDGSDRFYYLRDLPVNS